MLNECRKMWGVHVSWLRKKLASLVVMFSEESASLEMVRLVLEDFGTLTHKYVYNLSLMASQEWDVWNLKNGFVNEYWKTLFKDFKLKNNFLKALNISVHWIYKFL